MALRKPVADQPGEWMRRKPRLPKETRAAGGAGSKVSPRKSVRTADSLFCNPLRVE